MGGTIACVYSYIPQETRHAGRMEIWTTYYQSQARKTICYPHPIVVVFLEEVCLPTYHGIFHRISAYRGNKMTFPRMCFNARDDDHTHTRTHIHTLRDYDLLSSIFSNTLLTQISWFLFLFCFLKEQDEEKNNRNMVDSIDLPYTLRQTRTQTRKRTTRYEVSRVTESRADS